MKITLYRGFFGSKFRQTRLVHVLVPRLLFCLVDLSRLLPVGFPFSFGSGTLREARMNGENDEPHGGGQEPTRETKGTRRGPSETGEVSPEVG